MFTLENTHLTFFQISKKNMTFYVFLNDVSKSRKSLQQKFCPQRVKMSSYTLLSNQLITVIHTQFSVA